MIDERISLDELSGHQKELDLKSIFSNEVLASINVDPMLGTAEDAHGEHLDSILAQIRESKMVSIDPSDLGYGEEILVSASLDFNGVFDDSYFCDMPQMSVSTHRAKIVEVKSGSHVFRYAEPA